MSENRKGSFTLPGESGYEKLTLELAENGGRMSSVTVTGRSFPMKYWMRDMGFTPLSV